MEENVQNKIGKLLPKIFALVLDGWSVGSTHYLSLFASFGSDKSDGYYTRLFSFSPEEDETTMGSEEHKNVLEYFLGIYGKEWLNVVAIIGDN